ncbi:MAG TPA: glucosamine-6-phosphate deaminase [Planctomycetota bacterium]|nr:glucosamine-6-phosphate deaminase [Planctomycetota bacterium]
MEIIIEPDAAALAERASQVVFAELARKPDLVLGLATGKTPVGLYEKLRLKPDAFAQVRFFNLDEFFGLPPSDPTSFNYFLHFHLVQHVRHQEKNLHLLRGDVKDLEALSREVEESIKAVGGIDLQILGIGKNGHIGFNEPGSSLGSRTRPKTLEASTLAEYVKTLDPKAPVSNFAITMGVGTIMDARHLLLLASGSGKADIIREMVEGPITSEVPATCLQLHPRATVVLDEAAAAKLKRRDYYKWVFENKWRVGQK